ncbi:MAG: hypothetical protein WDM86_16900 [Rhizomicrobium sp.]
MSIVIILVLVLKFSIVLTVFAVGLDARPEETVFLLRRPEKLVRSLVAMNLVMPLFVMALVAIFPLPVVVKVTLVALSVSPVPPFLPGRVLKMGGSESYLISLLAIAALLSIVLAPVIVSLFGAVFGVETHTDVIKIALSVAISVLAPLAAGVSIRQTWPRVADAVARPIGTTAAVLLVVISLIGLVGLWPLIASLIGSGTVFAFLAFVVVALLVGHMLGGPEPDEQTVLAFATASRHPGVAIAIVAANFADTKLAAASVFLYLIVSILGAIPYTLWRKHHDRGVHAAAE